MNNTKAIEWVLRVGVAGEFVGHGVFALQGKVEWIKWIGQMTGADAALSGQLLWWVGALDIAVAVLVLVRPVRVALLWAAFWGLWTALVRPLMGLPVWDFVERSANWAAPLALLLILGWPKTLGAWLRDRDE